MVPALDTRNPAAVRRFLVEGFPSIRVTRPRLLMAGSEFDTWSTGDVVVKFPRDTQHAAKLRGEVDVHALIAGRLGALVPEVVAVAEPSEDFPFPAVAFRRARGRQGQASEGPIIRPQPWARTSLAVELAAALSTLHSTPLRAARGAGVRPGPRIDDRQFDASEEAVAWATRVAGDAVDAFLGDPVPSGTGTAPAGVVCHGDLKGEHLFVSEDGTRLTAIIDWADMAIADPATDLAGLAIWLGPSFVREVLRTYEGPADGGIFQRAVFLARSGLLGCLDEELSGEVEERAPVPLLDAQIRAVFGPESTRRRR